MKIIRFLSLVCLVTIISVFSGFVASYRAMGVFDSRYLPPPIKLENFKEPPQIPLSNNAFAFADIAWRTFVTLNWPANDARPLEELALGQAPLAPRVWEFYRTPEEVFLANGENPLLNISNPFARTLKLDLIKGQGAGSPENNVELRKNLQNSRAWIEKVIKSKECPAKIEVSDEEKNLLLNNIPIVDRQGNYIIVESHLNPNEFKQIVDNEWYNASKLAEYNEKKNFQFKSTNSSIDAPIEVKAAWRVFDESSSPEEKARYYTTKRVLAISAEQYVCTTDNCRTDDPVLEEVEVGLIGFHIAYKIPKQQSSTPGWVWATFEQVDNLKVDNGPLGLKPTLSNPDCDPNDPNKGSCLPNYPYVEWPFLWRDRSPHAVTLTQDGKIKPQIPTQAVRLSEQRNCRSNQLSDSVKKSLQQQNENWQKKFQNVARNSVWQYYQLVGTQWVQNPPTVSQLTSLTSDRLISNSRTGTTPGPLFNVAMEAYSQTQVNGDSCIGCHVTATLPSSSGTSEKAMSDFSFLLQRAKSSRNNVSSDGKPNS
ncbi:hypothetical protein [Argonema antarcticum]|uniref:hypothetical protein n=1 Tax=Argonema antarcticum TaxID=2942763 RepID=UPI00201368ED|nr:hypothetical protein [Argonema antarcticum]MCL1470663.1 hypothetical protein [Argonema antarcticum A004/B2]